MNCRLMLCLLLAVTLSLGAGSSFAADLSRTKTPASPNTAFFGGAQGGEEAADSSVLSPVIPEHEEGVLLALVETEEEAEEIAELYGITLEKFSHGLARYTTDKDVVELRQEGIDKGWPPVHFNMIYQVYSTQESPEAEEDGNGNT